jgi:hypothetical protein
MPITLMRWKSGAGGDTVMKILLDSDPTLLSQNQFVGLNNSQTKVDDAQVLLFRHSEIAKMSLTSYTQVNRELLNEQLTSLEQEVGNERWLLKTHCYFDFNWPVIDLVAGLDTLPFLIKASLIKNSREKNMLGNYHPLIANIKDPKILYKFDCYNLAVNYVNDCILNQKLSHQTLSVQSIIGGWLALSTKLQHFNFYVSDHCKQYYEAWLAQNQLLLPGDVYLNLIATNNLDYSAPGLSIEERYCLLALDQQQFKVINE